MTVLKKGDTVRFITGNGELSETTTKLVDVWTGKELARNCEVLNGGEVMAWHTDLLRLDGDTTPIEALPLEEWFICVGNAMGWGRAKTPEAAIANMRKASKPHKPTGYVVHGVHQYVTVGGMGGLTYPGFLPHPRELLRVDAPKKKVG